jgi:hypothetical protein
LLVASLGNGQRGRDSPASRRCSPVAGASSSGMVRFALARALVKASNDKRRAIELAEAAREGFARFAGAEADRKAVEAWLAAQR